MTYKEYKEMKIKWKKEEKEKFIFELGRINDDLQDALKNKRTTMKTSRLNDYEFKIIPFYLYSGHDFGFCDYIRINWHLIKRIQRLCKKYNIVSDDNE